MALGDRIVQIANETTGIMGVINAIFKAAGVVTALGVSTVGSLFTVGKLNEYLIKRTNLRSLQNLGKACDHPDTAIYAAAAITGGAAFIYLKGLYTNYKANTEHNPQTSARISRGGNHNGSTIG